MKTARRGLALLLTALLLLSAVPLFAVPAAALTPGYSCSAQYKSSVYYQRLCAVSLGTDMRQNIVNVARSQVGYHEGNSTADLGGGNGYGYADYTEYGYYYGTSVLGSKSGYFLPWCALFVTWCARMANIPTDVIASSPSANPNYFGIPYHAYRANEAVQPGDIVFLSYGGNGFDHVAIVSKVDATFIYTIDGNYSAGVRESAKYYRSNGQDYYPQNGARIGYVATPAYRTSTISTVVDKDDEYGGFPEPVRTLSYTSGGAVMTGADVSWVQYTLMRMGYSVTVDGSYGPATKEAVTLFQKISGLSRTGAVDAATRKQIRYMIDTFFVIDSDPPPGYFADVAENAWYYTDVQNVYVSNLFTGTAPYTFAPGIPMNRAMFTTVLWRLAGQPSGSAAAPFRDVKASAWYADPVAWASAHGIVNGTDPTHFSPNQNVSREQIAALLYRYASSRGFDTSHKTALSAPDAAAISDWAKDAVCWAVQKGLIKGREGGYLAPRDSATRAEVAAIVVRFSALYQSK